MAKGTVQLKTCMTCRATKPVAEFYRCKRWRDGLSYRCKDCDREAAHRYNTSDKGRARAREQRRRFRASPKGKACIEAYSQSEQYKQNAKRYRQTAASKARMRRQRLRDMAAGKQNARDAVSNAVRRGQLPSARSLRCRECGGPASGYHHHLGYEREHHLHVIPVCAKCHKALHRPPKNQPA